MFSFKAQNTGNLLVPRLIFISLTFLRLSASTSQNKKKSKKKKRASKGRKKITKKSQGTSIESTSHMAQRQLEREMQRCPKSLNKKMIRMRNTKQWTECIKEEWKLWNKAFEVMGLGSQQLCPHDKANVASASFLGVQGLGRNCLPPDFPSVPTAASPGTGQGRNQGFPCHESSWDTKLKNR